MTFRGDFFCDELALVYAIIYTIIYTIINRSYETIIGK